MVIRFTLALDHAQATGMAGQKLCNQDSKTEVIAVMMLLL